MCGRETLDGGQAHQLLDRDNAQVCGSSGQRQLCAVEKTPSLQAMKVLRMIRKFVFLGFLVWDMGSWVQDTNLGVTLGVTLLFWVSVPSGVK